MKSKLINSIWVFLLISAFFSACIPHPASLPETNANFALEDQLLIGEVYKLQDGEVIHGNIAGIGATLILENGSLIEGDINLLGSTLEVAGTVRGDINVLAGTSSIQSTAQIQGDINQIFHQINISPDSHVLGDINTFSIPAPVIVPLGKWTASLTELFKPTNWIAFQFSRTLAFCVLTVLIYYLFKKHTNRVIKAIEKQSAISWGTGLLTIIAMPIIILILILSIILIPVGLVLVPIYILALLFSWITLGIAIGRGLNRWLHLTLADEMQALFGAFILGITTSLLSWIPCIGWLINLMALCVGLGGVVISGFGFSEEFLRKKPREPERQPPKPPREKLIASKEKPKRTTPKKNSQKEK
jgi:hypothetical protein